MFRLGCLQQPLGRWCTHPSAGLLLECRTSSPHQKPIARFVRYASQSKRPPSQPRTPVPIKSAKPNIPTPYARKRQVDPSKKASSLLNHISKAKHVAPPNAKPPAPKTTVKPVKSVKAELVDDDGSPRQRKEFDLVDAVKKRFGTAVEVDDDEIAIQKRIIQNRKRLLWPGIWTVLALAGTWGVLAYLDARLTGFDLSGASSLGERISIPQTWVLWPSVAWEGIKAGWKEVDNLSLGLMVAMVGFHLLRGSPLPIWEKMIHITGEKMYTTFTYPLVHINWQHVLTNMYVISWFLPGVVHYFGGDTFQAAALFFSVPLITSYGTHYVFRFVNVSGIPLNMGSSGVASALFGAFCVAYPDEKVWLPTFTIFRLDAKYCSAAFIGWQVAQMLTPQRGGNRSVHFVSIIGLFPTQSSQKYRYIL